MKRLIAGLVGGFLWLATANASLEDDGVWAAGVWATTVWADGVWYESGSGLIAVPNVVGEANFAAADAILEAASLDGGTETVRCSAATADEIISQNPSAGLSVAASTAVDLISSSGTACAGRALQIGIEQRMGVDL